MSNNILKAKIQIGDLFCDLTDLSDIIDNNDYSAIKRFKNMFFKNIKYPPLFGKISLSNDNLVKAEIEQLNMHLNSKIKELNSYLDIIH